MRRKPVHNFANAVNLGSRGYGGALDHDDLDPQSAGRVDLGARAGTARVLGHNDIDLVVAKQGEIVVKAEGSAINDDFAIREGKRLGRFVDQTKQVEMLRVARKGIQMHPANRQHNTAGLSAQRISGAFDAVDVAPVVSGLRDPRLTRQRDQLNSGGGASFNRIPAYLRRKGMGGVDHMGKTLRGNETRKTVGTAKPALAHRNGLRLGVFDASGQRHHGVHAIASNPFGKGAGFDCTTKYQEVGPHA